MSPSQRLLAGCLVALSLAAAPSASAMESLCRTAEAPCGCCAAEVSVEQECDLSCWNGGTASAVQAATAGSVHAPRLPRSQAALAPLITTFTRPSPITIHQRLPAVGSARVALPALYLLDCTFRL